MTIVTVGKLTYAEVDLPDDRWAWAIVTDHKGSQEYGEVIVAFMDGYEPDHEMVRNMMSAMEARNRVMVVPTPLDLKLKDELVGNGSSCENRTRSPALGEPGPGPLEEP